MPGSEASIACQLQVQARYLPLHVKSAGAHTAHWKGAAFLG